MKFAWKKIPVWLLVVLGSLICIRIALPFGVKWYANKVLDKNPGYKGRITDVDLHLWRGAYSIHGLVINKINGEVPVPFFKTKKLDLSLSWKDLWHGSFVARIKFENPEINFADGDSEKEKQSGKEGKWSDTLDKLAPFKINRLLVENGTVHFRNFSAHPPVDIWIKSIQGELKNLTNIEKKEKDNFTYCWIEGLALGNGKLEVDLNLNPKTDKPTFILNAKLLNLELTELNSFFKKYALLDFEKGQGDIVVQIKSDNGQMDGYVKPLFKNLEVFSFAKDLKKDKSFFSVAVEVFVEGFVQLFKNQPKDQFATKIPLKGKIDAPKSELLPIIGGILRNAFIQAFNPFYDNTFQVKKSRAVAE